jgi:transposase
LFSLKPESLQYWYKNFLSDYFDDIDTKKWPPQKIEKVDKSTGEVTEKPVYIFKKENIGENMSIDDKAIGHDGFTVLSNHQTSKIALLVESTNAEEVEAAMELFGEELKKVKNISMDMSATYSLVSDNLMPHATQVIDKYHVMKYVYDVVSGVRKKIRKSLAANLTKGKKKTEEDKQILSQIELVRRVRHAVTQSPNKWNQEMKKTIEQVFDTYDDLKKAYQISQNFKHWYDYQNHTKSIEQITKSLHKWYQQAKQLTEFESVIKMIRKHEDEIINFFRNGMTNARAERLNGKINRFVTNNYGVKNKDFILYRMAGYFS